MHVHILATLWFPLVASSLVTASLLPTRTNDATPFVTENDGQLIFNGSTYPYIAVDAYWLATLAKEQDVADVLSSVSKLGISNVVVPAYNLVNEYNVPAGDSKDSWLQLLHKNGSISFNEGANGFKRLDTLLKQAKLHDIHVDLTLSNNFDPRAVIANQAIANLPEGIVDGFNATRARNYLRNDFGGADFISATLGSTCHDFFTNQTIIDIYKTIVDDILRRYKDETAVGSWTPLKDAQCQGSLPSSDTCDTTAISTWHNDVAQFIQERDPNHLVVASTTGYECNLGDGPCPKLFNPSAAPPPAASPAPGTRRTTKTRRQKMLERKEKTKKARAIERARSPLSANDGIQIRGRWISTGGARRQSTNEVANDVTDGSSGVDVVDLGNSAAGALSSSYLPFEKKYFKNQDNSNVENIIALGNTWIERQASIRDQLQITKPVYLVMGVPLLNYTDYFVFANSSVSANEVQDLEGDLVRRQSSGNENVIGVSSAARTQIWTSWFSTARIHGINIIAQGLGASGVSTSGTSYTNDNDSTSSSDDSDSTTSSPNDGYNIVANDDSDSGMQSVISSAANELQISR